MYQFTRIHLWIRIILSVYKDFIIEYLIWGIEDFQKHSKEKLDLLDTEKSKKHLEQSYFRKSAYKFFNS